MAQSKAMTPNEIKAAFETADEELKGAPVEIVELVYEDDKDQLAQKAEWIAKRAVAHLESLDVLPGGNQSLMAAKVIARVVEEAG